MFDGKTKAIWTTHSIVYTHIRQIKILGRQRRGGARLKRAALHGVCDKRRVSNTTGR